MLMGRITLQNDSSTKTFTFLEQIDENGKAAVTYRAYKDDTTMGTLQEFYPKWFGGLKRDSEGYVSCSAEKQEEFYRLRDDYLRPYMLIAGKEHNQLAALVPAFEIYHGGDTAYIWTPKREDYTFDKFCRVIHKHPSIGAKYRLIQVFRGFKALAECTAYLHNLSIFNLGIKPSNLGFTERLNEPLIHILSMFETTTTEGDNAHDIHAIGEAIFRAIVVTPETNDASYPDEHLERIDELVNSSKLIQSAGLGHKLKSKISELLRNV